MTSFNEFTSLLNDKDIVERLKCTEQEKIKAEKTIELLCEMTDKARKIGYSILQNEYLGTIHDKFFREAITQLISSGSASTILSTTLPGVLTEKISGLEFTEKLIILCGLTGIITGLNRDNLKSLLENFII